jgi:hypothetical protein
MANSTNPALAPSDGFADRRRTAPNHWLSVAQTSLWTLLSLGAIDLGIGRLFPMPEAADQEPSAMARYFDYGRSIGGKLDRVLGATAEKAGPLANVGWLTPEVLDSPDLPSKPSPGKRLVAFYGMSFTNKIAEAMVQQDPNLEVRTIAAPAAPPNYTYAAYQADRSHQKADVVVLGILSQSIAAMNSTNGATWMFEGPSPYTFPKYSVANGKLQSIEPTITTPQAMRDALHNPARWADYQTELAANDRFYAPWVYDSNFADNSALLRLVRRATAKARQRGLMDQVYSKTNGFTDPKINETLRAMVVEFAATAKADGKQPIVMIINSKDYSNAAYKLLQPTLDQAKIPYLSTHRIADPADPTVFIPDGHFTPAITQKLTEATRALIGAPPPPKPLQSKVSR